MTGPVFVDTNVLVYRSDASDPVKQARAESWYAFLWRSRAGRLSFQVLLELYSTLTRKMKPGVDAREAREIVRELTAWKPIQIGPAVVERAWFLEERHALSWWDAMIVAAAQGCGCSVLLTEDLQHGQVFDAVRVVNPFVAPHRTPSEVLAAEP